MAPQHHLPRDVYARLWVRRTQNRCMATPRLRDQRRESTGGHAERRRARMESCPMETDVSSRTVPEPPRSVSWRAELVLAACDASPLAGEMILTDLRQLLWFQPGEIAQAKAEARSEGRCLQAGTEAGRRLTHQRPQGRVRRDSLDSVLASPSSSMDTQHSAGCPSVTAMTTDTTGKRAFVSEDDLRRERAKRQALANNLRNPHGLSMSERVAALQSKLKPGGGGAPPSVWHMPYG